MQLLNNYIAVKELEVGDASLNSGLILPETEQEEDQVAQGIVRESANDNFKKGDVVLFHKMIPVDAQLKLENGDIERFWFIKESDVICKL